ncbi:MAG TPA: 50S ribosomal protein L11 methyltransferase [Vicinamibacterales bacterium]|nr:50S ribosomal protein L11 methyltransferase [Vicinamibacterales bacterium]
MVELIEEHRGYLADAARLDAYTRALSALVAPGDVVVDLAAGTGVLGMLACRAGASRVYAIEEGPIAGLARRIVKANGFEDRVVIVRAHSSEAILPERGDVLVADQLGPFGIDAGVIDVFRDARARLLRPGAALVPSTLELVTAPVVHPRTHERISFWAKKPAGLDMTATFDTALNAMHVVRIRSAQLLGAPAVLLGIDLGLEPADELQGSCSHRITRPGMLHGIGGWFVATLAPSVILTNSPTSAERIRRRQVIFPLREAIPVDAGDVVDATFRFRPSDDVYAWDVTVSAGSGRPRRFRHSTFAGLVLERGDLRRTAPSYRPCLSQRGAARLTVLQLCRGGAAVGEIEAEVYERHGTLFASRAQADRFVAEIVSRDARASS